MHLRRVVAAVAVLPLLVAAKEPIRLAPSSKWVVDYAEDSCRLLRSFGEGEDKSTLVLERAAPGVSMSMLVIGKPFAAPAGADDFTAQFKPHEFVRALHGQAAKSADRKSPAILWTRMSFLETHDDDVSFLTGANRKKLQAAMKEARERKTPEPVDRDRRTSMHVQGLVAAAKVEAIDIHRNHGPSVILESGSMGQANQMMNECANRQLKAWGIDPDLEDKIVTPVFAPSVSGWFTYADYPKESLWDPLESTCRHASLSIL